MAPITLLSDLPPLTVIRCTECSGEGYFPGDDTDPASGCLACDGTGEVEVCAGCGAVPTVVNGLETCHCSVIVKRAA